MTLAANAAPSPLVTGTVLAVSSLTILANATIAPALPGLSDAFADVPGIEGLAGLALSLPSLSIILSAALFGWLADRVDPLRVLLAAMLVYALAGASGALAPSIGTILVGRFALGFGVAGTMTIATLYASTLWSGPARARFMGWQFAATSLVGMFLLVGGGLLAERHWRAPFLIYLVALPIALLAWAALRGRLAGRDPDAPRPAPVAFPWPAFARIGGLACFTMLVFYLIPTRLPFLLEAIGVGGPSAAGVAIAAVTLAGIPGSFWFGALRARFGAAPIAAACFATVAAGFVLISFAGSLAGVIAGTLVVGAGLGPAIPNFLAWLMGAVPEGARGRASGLFTVAIFGGQFLSPIVSHAVSDRVGLARTFDVFAVALLVVALGTFVLGRRAGSPAPASASTPGEAPTPARAARRARRAGPADGVSPPRSRPGRTAARSTAPSWPSRP